jgi:hypothetical protein
MHANFSNRLPEIKQELEKAYYGWDNQLRQRNQKTSNIR